MKRNPQWAHDFTHMLAEYYSLRGWDQEGVPLKETLARLEL